MFFSGTNPPKKRLFVLPRIKTFTYGVVSVGPDLNHYPEALRFFPFPLQLPFKDILSIAIFVGRVVMGPIKTSRAWFATSGSGRQPSSAGRDRRVSKASGPDIPWHMSAMLIKDAQRGVANVTTRAGGEQVSP